VNALPAWGLFALIVLTLTGAGAVWFALGTWWDRRHTPAAVHIPRQLPAADPSIRRYLNRTAAKELAR
jgi:hypothetical protein